MTTLRGVYLSAVGGAVVDRRRLRFAGGNVVALGTVSLATGVPAKMFTAFLPVYLVVGLDLSPLAYGAFAGGCIGATALLRLVRGRVVSLAAVGGLVLDQRVRRLALVATALGLATVGDGFVYLLLHRREGVDLVWFPLLAVGSYLAYLLLADAVGVVAERVGRTRVLLVGQVLLAAVYALLSSPFGGWPLVLAVLVLQGAFHATTDGILPAMAGPALPEWLRTTGLTLVHTCQAVAYLGSSLLFGVAWQMWGAEAALRAAAVVALVALAVTLILLRLVRP